MKKVYGFKTYRDAIAYADKNYHRNTYRIVETNLGTFAIEKIFE